MVKNYIRFGIQSKKDFLNDARNSYDGIILPANILLYQYKATPSIIYTTQKPFFIDPMSYLFGKNLEKLKKNITPNNKQFKPSFQKLVMGHGLDPKSMLNWNPEILLKKLLHNENFLNKFIRSSLEFQYKNVKSAEEHIKEIDESLLSNESINLTPEFLIIPYLTITETNFVQILDVLQKFIETSERIYKPSMPPIWILLNLSKEALKEENIRIQCVRLAKNKFLEGVVIWIDDFSEVKNVTKELVESYIKLIQDIQIVEKKIHILYGGYFSFILHHFGVKSVSHGAGYGESKSVSISASKGGPPLVRYYIKGLKNFFILDKAQRILKKFPNLMCTCRICQRVMRNDPSNVTKFKDEEDYANFHFLQSRYDERKLINNSSLEETILNLEETYNTYKNEQDLDIDHIKIWTNALKTLKNDN